MAKRQFKHFEERVRGVSFRAVIPTPDADGFGLIDRWEAVVNGKIIETAPTAFKLRCKLWPSKKRAEAVAAIKAPKRPRTIAVKPGKPVDMLMARPAPKPSQIKRRSGKGTKHKFPKAMPEDQPTASTGS